MVPAAAKFLPESTFAWDNASNNKFLVSGQGSLIMNPPSAWAVAVRDAPQIAEQSVDLQLAEGPEGPLRLRHLFPLGDLAVLEEQGSRQGAAALPDDPRGPGEAGDRRHRLRHPAVQEHDGLQGVGGGGAAERHQLQLPAARRCEVNVSGYPAPPKIGTQMYAQATLCKMIAACTQQKKVDRTGDEGRRGGNRRLHALLASGRRLRPRDARADSPTPRMRRGAALFALTIPPERGKARRDAPKRIGSESRACMPGHLGREYACRRRR